MFACSNSFFVLARSTGFESEPRTQFFVWELQSIESKAWNFLARYYVDSQDILMVDYASTTLLFILPQYRNDRVKTVVIAYRIDQGKEELVFNYRVGPAHFRQRPTYHKESGDTRIYHIPGVVTKAIFSSLPLEITVLQMLAGV